MVGGRFKPNQFDVILSFLRRPASSSMASPSTSSAPAIPPKYEYLKSLCDIQTIRDLTEDAVRDILRNKTNDHGLEVVEMGQISDMSGLNDAFNSTICSLKVKAKFSGKGPSAAAAGEGEGEGGGGAGIYTMDECALAFFECMMNHIVLSEF